MTKDGSTSSATAGVHVASTSPMTVGILGHVGNENLGDEAIIAAVIQNVRRQWPHAVIYGFTLVPDDTEQRHGIPSFPIRRRPEPAAAVESPSGGSASDPSTGPSLLHRLKEWVKRIPVLSSLARHAQAALEAVPEIGREVKFLRDCRQSARGLDLLIFAGSHQLNDFVNGPWAYPYTVLKWTLLAREAGAKVVFLSLGAGPIDTWLGRRFIRSALERASYRSYRDPTSKAVVDSLHVFETDEVTPDLAFSLDSPAVRSRSARSGAPIVGINPLPFYTDYWHTSDQKKYEAYVGKLAAFADWLVERGSEVRFIPTQLKVDPAVIGDVRRRMLRNGAPQYDELIVEPSVHSLEDLLSALADLDVMVATRYHGILLSLALHKPVMAIAYHDKSRDLMRWLGQGDYVIDGETFSLEALTERFSRLEKELGSIGSALQQQTPDFRSSVRAQYDQVFRLMEGVSEAAPQPRA